MTDHRRSSARARETPETARTRAEREAWRSLAGYKFVMFGYHAGVWVNMNRLCETPEANPWKGLVREARRRRATGARPVGGGDGTARPRP